MKMSRFSDNSSRQVLISLRGLSHEVCVAVTQTSYWEQITQGSSISISSNGIFVPVELESLCSEEDEPRLRLIIQAQSEQDTEQLDTVCMRIRYDLTAFENNDRPVFEPSTGQVFVYGSLFNSLSTSVFDTQRHMVGQRNSKIKQIKHELACSLYVDDSIPQRFRFTIHHRQHTLVRLAVVQVQALVKQAQYQYIIAFASKIGQQLTGSVGQMEITQSTDRPLNNNQFPSFTSFEPSVKRKRSNEDEEHATTSATAATIPDSDDSDDEDIITDEKRQQRREQMELLLTGICDRMRARAPVDDVAKAREDWSQIKSYFRSSTALKAGGNEPEVSIEVVEHEIDLRTRGMPEHKCTLVFNKQLKMGIGSRDRVKKTAKARAYEQLKKMTRSVSRETLVVKKTRDGLWKAVVSPPKNG